MMTLNDGRSELWQWDTSRKLSVDADCTQVHFSNKVFGRSIDVDVVDGVAIIPDILLQTEKEITAWAFVGTAENGYTKISKIFKVNKRNKPADYVFTQTDQTTLGKILDRIEDLENRPSVDVSEEDIQNAVNDYLDRNPVSVEEKDPTVPEWAKQPNKPSYTAQEVGALPADTFIPALPDTSETGQRAWVKHKEIITTEETWGVTVDLSDRGVLPSFSEIKMHVTFPDTSSKTSLTIQFSSDAGLIFKATYTNAIEASKQTRFYGHASNDGSFVSGYVNNDWDFIPLSAKKYVPFDAGSVKSITVSPTSVKLAVGVLIEIWGR